MSPTTQAFLAALIGAVVAGGAVLAWSVSQRQQANVPPAEEPVVPAGVATVLSVLRSSAVVVDDDDEVVKASAPAIALGLVRSQRLASTELAELVRLVRRDGQIREVDLVLPRRTGPSRTVTARVAPLSSRLVLVLVEDRTLERRVESVRRDFVANVSHELKTPVGAIKLLAEAVGDASDDPEAVERFARRMLTESDRLLQMVQQIIELSRLQGDEPLEAPAVVDVDAVIARSIDVTVMDAGNKHIKVVPGGTSGLRIFGNEEQVSAAVTNLLANAVTYSGEDSTVLISTKAVRRHGRDLGRRPGHRHPARRARPHLRTVLPGRPGPPPVHRGHRARTLDRQARRGHPRWRRTRVVAGGAGVHLHPVPPAVAPGGERMTTQTPGPLR